MAAAVTQQQNALPGELAVAALSNDQLIVELLQTTNHLSRWLTPVHDRTQLEFSPRRSQPSVKDVLLTMRDTETWVYSYLYAIATEINPDLDRVIRPERSAVQQEVDRRADALVVMSEFRRIRQSSASLLRALPDSAWDRGGYSRRERNWTIRQLGEYLVTADREHLREIDRILEVSGARQGIARVSQVGFERIDEPFVG